MLQPRVDGQLGAQRPTLALVVRLFANVVGLVLREERDVLQLAFPEHDLLAALAAAPTIIMFIPGLARQFSCCCSLVGAR